MYRSIMATEAPYFLNTVWNISLWFHFYISEYKNISFCKFEIFKVYFKIMTSLNKGNNKITELRTILQRESPIS